MTVARSKLVEFSRKAAWSAALLSLSLALFAVTCASRAVVPAALAQGSEPVIPAGQEELLADMLGRGAALPGGCSFARGAANGSTVTAAYSCPGGEVVFDLVHPNRAPSDAERTARFALVLRSGAPPPELVDGLLSRFRARESAFEWKWIGGSRVPALHLASLVAFLILALSLLPGAETRFGGALQIGGVVALVILAAWPLLFLPIDTDAPVIRAACAASDIFGDAFHPFLPFLLERPVTWFSMQPWAFRLVPLAFLAGETVLMTAAARREGGGLAGALAAVWFANEIPRRHGLWDLSDWDFAGTFLMAMLFALQRRPKIEWRRAILLAALMVAGVLSSYMMIVPAGVLTGCLLLQALRDRSKAVPAIAVGAVFAGLAILSLNVFAAGSRAPREIVASELWQGMYAELPVAHHLAMLLPLALAIVWLTMHIGRLAPQFAALCVIAVPTAVWVAFRGSHVAGGYYIGLVTPLLLWAAAVATAQLTRTVAHGAARFAPWRAQPWLRSGTRVAVVIALAAATVDRTGPAETPDPVNYLRALAHESRTDRLPIYTNRGDLARLIAFERARAGDAALTLDDAMGGPADLRGRLVVIQDTGCPAAPARNADGFYVAYFGRDSGWPTCLEPRGSRCRNLAPAPSSGPHGAWLILRCGAG